jgi:(p)ppGpp synthase/HD superfamily hydrolase
MIDRAIAITPEAHQEQLDKAGQPYINHPMRVMAAVVVEMKSSGLIYPADADMILAKAQAA